MLKLNRILSSFNKVLCLWATLPPRRDPFLPVSLCRGRAVEIIRSSSSTGGNGFPFAQITNRDGVKLSGRAGDTEM